jgi:hypothetical protein
MSTLKELKKICDEIDWDVEWDTYKETYGIVVVDFERQQIHPRHFAKGDCNGVYRMTYKDDNEKDRILYVGKSDATTSTIHGRILAHIRSLKVANNICKKSGEEFSTSESSGQNITDFFKSKNQKLVIIEIDYVDLSELGKNNGITELSEISWIHHFKTEINFETKEK